MHSILSKKLLFLCNEKYSYAKKTSGKRFNFLLVEIKVSFHSRSSKDSSRISSQVKWEKWKYLYIQISDEVKGIQIGEGAGITIIPIFYLLESFWNYFNVWLLKEKKKFLVYIFNISKKVVGTFYSVWSRLVASLRRFHGIPYQFSFICLVGNFNNWRSLIHFL